mgnify:CR=1 FL=1
MVKINKPLPSTSTAVEYMLTRLSRFCGRNERGFWINQNSVATLEKLGVNLSRESRPLLRGLLRLANPAINLCGLEVPAELTEAHNLPFLSSLGRKGELPRLIDHNWRLDLGLITIKKETKIDFDGEVYLAEIRTTYDKKANPLAHSNMEIGDKVLYQNLLDILDKLYEFDMIRSRSSREGKPEAEKKAWAAMAILGQCLRDMLKDEGFPFGTINYRLLYQEQLKIAADRIEDRNPGAAETTLVSLIKRMEDDLERLEMSLVSEQRKAATIQVKSDDELVKMGMEYYQIKLNKDGTINVPQSGFSKKGGVLIRELRSQQVAAEDAVRQQQHEIDNIKENIKTNATFINLLSSHALTTKEGKSDLHRVILDLAAAVVEYENGRLQIKQNTARRLNRALEKTKAAVVTVDEKTRSRQLKFSISVMNIAAHELGLLNPRHERQLSHILVRKRLLELITDKIFMRDFKLKELADKAISKLQRPFTPAGIWSMVREANVILKEYKPDDQTEFGIEAAMKKVKQLSNDLATIGRVLGDKKKTGEAIADAREELALGIARARALKTDREQEMIAALKRSSVSRMRFILKKLKSHTEEAASKAYWAIREALLINYYLENKGQVEDKGKESAHLAANHDQLLERMRKRDSVFMPVVSVERDKKDHKKTTEIEIGQALPRDVIRYKLKTRKVVS